MGADPQAMLTNALLIAGLIALIWLGAAIIDRYRRELVEGVRTDEDIEADFRAAYERGELDENEYRLIQEALQRKADAAAEPQRSRTSSQAGPSAGRGPSPTWGHETDGPEDGEGAGDS